MRTVQIGPTHLTSISRALLTLSHALRGLDHTSALLEVENIFQLLAQLYDRSSSELRQALPLLEETVALQSLQPSPITYPKLWEKILRRFDTTVSVLSEGNVSQSLPNLMALQVALLLLPEHRIPFIEREGGDIKSPIGMVAGTHAEGRQQVFVQPALAALKTATPNLTAIAHFHALAERSGKEAMKFLVAGRYSEASQALKSALGINPSSGEWRLLLGEILKRMEHIEEAKMELLFVLEQEAVFLRLAQHQQGRLLSKSRQARAHFAIGRLELSQGDITTARFHLTTAGNNFDWITRRGADGSLAEADLNHMIEDGNACLTIIERLNQTAPL